MIANSAEHVRKRNKDLKYPDAPKYGDILEYLYEMAKNEPIVSGKQNADYPPARDHIRKLLNETEAFSNNPYQPATYTQKENPGKDSVLLVSAVDESEKSISVRTMKKFAEIALQRTLDKSKKLAEDLGKEADSMQSMLANTSA